MKKTIVKNVRKCLLRTVIGTFVLLSGWFYAGGAGGRVCVQAASFTIEQNVINVHISSPTTARKAIEDALNYAHSQNDGQIYTVKVAAGTYDLNGTLNIYGNTILDVTGVTFNYTKSSGNMLMLGSSSTNKDESLMGGYGTIANIAVIGGTWVGNSSCTSSLIRMAHASNVTFEQCVFKGGGCSHQMEVASIDGFTVKGCTFRDLTGKLTSGKKEALQLDMPCSDYVFSGVVLDGTPMKNVEITGCTFKNVPRGLGTHNMLIGQYHTNIKITDNTFENVNGECIITLNYKNCDISNNTIKNCGAGIVVESFRSFLEESDDIKATYTTIYDGTQTFSGANDHDADTRITGNTITLDSDLKSDEAVGIRVYGYDLEKNQQAVGNGSSDVIPADNYYISNVSVTNNTIVTYGKGIHFSDVRDGTISGNKITNDLSDPTEEDGILVEAESKNISIRNNTVKNATEYGIRVEDYSSAKTISGNTVNGSEGYGISVCDNCRVTGSIKDNVVKNCNDTGICLEMDSTVKSIADNTVTSCYWHGILLYNGSKATGSITGNIISKCGRNGIFLNLDSKAKSITNNTLKQNENYAIALYKDSVVSSITKNTIKSSSIVIDTNSKKKITIKKNSITAKKGKKSLLILHGNVKSDIKK